MAPRDERDDKLANLVKLVYNTSLAPDVAA